MVVWFNDPQGFIRTIVYLNIGMYILSLLFNRGGYGISINPFSFLSPDSRSLLILGATGTIPIDRLHRWWTILSANYLHGGILHIFFNMMAFYQLSPISVKEYGMYRTFIIYTLSGMLGFLISYIAGITLTIGASAAIFGLIGAIVYYGRSRGGIYGTVLYRQIGGWAIGLFIFGLLVPGINNWGHGGGFAGGILLGLLLGYNEKKREDLTHKLLAGICMAGTIVILLWAILSGIPYLLAR